MEIEKYDIIDYRHKFLDRRYAYLNIWYIKLLHIVAKLYIFYSYY